MNEKKNITIEIEILKCGQPHSYGNSEFEFLLTVDGMNNYEVEKYCTEILRHKRQTFSEWQAGKANCQVYYEGYYVFEKVGDKQYRYYCLEPYCD